MVLSNIKIQSRHENWKYKEAVYKKESVGLLDSTFRSNVEKKLSEKLNRLART